MNWAYAWLWLLLSTGCTAHLEKRVSLLETQVAELRARLPSGKFSEGDPRNRTTYEENSGFAGLGTGEPHSPMLATRAGTGTYSLYAGPVVSGTTISSTYWNNTLADLATEMTDSLSRSGKGGMLAALALTVGSVTAPSVYFSGDANTGLYWVSADNFAATAGGTQAQSWSTTGATLPLGATVTNSQTNGDGVASTGNGTGAGFRGTGGGSGGSGVVGTGTTTGTGGYFTGGATGGTGVFGFGVTTGAGGNFTGGATGVGVAATGGATSGASLRVLVGNAATGPFRFDTSSQPTGASAVGDMYMTSAGVLKVCTVAGTPGTWVSVGSQP